MTPEEEIVHLKKRCRDLAIAFENIDAERKYLRRNLAAIRELAFKMAELTSAYEGQDNVSEPSEETLQSIG